MRNGQLQSASHTSARFNTSAEIRECHNFLIPANAGTQECPTLFCPDPFSFSDYRQISVTVTWGNQRHVIWGRISHA
jgi:hypothetical protein